MFDKAYIYRCPQRILCAADAWSVCDS